MEQRADQSITAAARSWMPKAGPARARYVPPARCLLMGSLAVLAASVLPTPAAAEWVQRGNASWYGSVHHGRKMANGRRFDMWGRSVAHRTLPFGSRVRIRNLRNGREVVAMVEDRGPFIPGRVVDLSRGLARTLDAEQPGVVPVEIRLVGP